MKQKYVFKALQITLTLLYLSIPLLALALKVMPLPQRLGLGLGLGPFRDLALLTILTILQPLQCNSNMTTNSTD